MIVNCDGLKIGLQAFCCMMMVGVHSLWSDDRILDRPIAITVTDDGATAFIGNQNQPFITRLDTNTHEVSRIDGDWVDLVDLVLIPKTRRMLVVAKTPPRLYELDVDSQTAKGTRRHKLPGVPAKIAISIDGQFACVSMTWKHAVCLIALTDRPLSDDFSFKMLSLDFQPKELFPLENGSFLVADAFGSQLAVVDASANKIIASHKLLGHHISGIARDESLQVIIVTHQKLSGIAQSSRDDIHWGTLIQNVVSIIPESQLLDSRADIAGSAERVLIGNVGNGAADPSSVVARDGRLVIAISGTNQIAFRDNPSARFQFLDLEQPPSQLVKVAGSKYIGISLLGNTASLLEYTDGLMKAIETIGVPRVLQTEEERGEAAYFSGRLSHDGWMSCNSCHVDGHSPDLLADTMGDGQFGNPKKIPSLLGTARTGPWAWNGSEDSLEGQIQRTLNSTMHRSAKSRSALGDDRSVARDIAAFLRKKVLPSETADSLLVDDSNDLSQGRSLFQNRGCVRCHHPDQQYTSSESYDVGVVDELGSSLFNPPSLKGLAHRKSYFHDARFQTIQQLLDVHPDTKQSWTDAEKAALKRFLNSL